MWIKQRKNVDIWDSFKNREMCTESEGPGWRTTTTDLITQSRLLRISGFSWQLKINRAVNEHPQRRRRVSSLSAASPMWRGSCSNGFSWHPTQWIWSEGEQRGKLEVTSSFLPWLISANNGTTGERRLNGREVSAEQRVWENAHSTQHWLHYSIQGKQKNSAAPPHLFHPRYHYQQGSRLTYVIR